MAKLTTTLIFLFFVAACTPVSVNELPMYGASSFEEHMTLRSPAQEKADNAFIREATAILDAENASFSIMGGGFEYLSTGDVSTAIKRFNQAGLLYQDNPYVYVGLSYALLYKGDYKKAESLLTLALEKESTTKLIATYNNTEFLDNLQQRIFDKNTTGLLDDLKIGYT